MANYATLKAAIQDVVKTNGNEEITGALLQQTLLAMVNSLGEGFHYMGPATPLTNPGTPDQNVFYLASTAGTYSNFGGITLADGEIAILKYNGSWTKDSTGAASLEKVSQLQAKVTDLEDKTETTIVHNKNLADKAVSVAGLTINSSAKIAANANTVIVKFPCKPSTTYTVSKVVTPHFRIAYSNQDPVYNVQCAGMITDNSASSITITTAADSAYLVMYVYNSSDTTQTMEQIMASLQIEIGSVATPYVAPGWEVVDGTARAAISALAETEQADKAELNAKIDERTLARVDDWMTYGQILTQLGFIRPTNGSEGSNDSYFRSDFLVVAGAKKFVIYGKFSSGIAPIAFYDGSKNFISAESVTETAYYTINAIVPENAVYFRMSTTEQARTDLTLDAFFLIATQATKAEKIFISPTGNDINDGRDETHPVATFNAAKNLISDGGELVMMPGDYESAGRLDLSAFAKITGQGQARIICHTQKIDSATLVSGNIYKAAYTGPSGYPNTRFTFLYLHDMPDPATTIPAGEIHPLQRGRTCRMPSTRIYKKASVADIEADTTHLGWYYDGTDIYFSLPENTDLSVNPVIIPDSETLTASQSRTVEIRNISIWYNNVLLQGLSGVLDNVSVGMGSNKAGQIRCDYCKSLLLRNCEAFGAYTTNGGDGVNTHNTDTSISDRSFVTLENCWLHDNADDGESCHENSTTVHYGCLVEYNGNGITPAAGGGTECHECIVRRNGSYDWVTDSLGTGFSAQGGSLTCYGCFAENNVFGYYATSNAVLAVALNSVAKNNYTNFSERVLQINCATINP